MGKKEKQVAKKVNDKNVQTLNSKSILEFIPFKDRGAYPDGIIEFNPAKILPGKNPPRYFSKMFYFDDANFITESEEKQEVILLNYQKLLNSLPDNVNIQFIIINSKLSNKQMKENYYLKLTGDKHDGLREDYNKIISEKIEEGHNNIHKMKYFVLTMEASDYPTAQRMFGALEVKVQETFKSINRIGFKALGLWDRLEVMYYILHYREEETKLSFNSINSKFFNEVGGVNTIDVNAVRRANVNAKKLIAPETISKNKAKGIIQLGEKRFCKSVQLIDFPQSISTEFLTNITNTPCEMVMFIDFTSVKKKTAEMWVKNKNTAVKSDIIDVTKKAYKNGLNPEIIMSEDLVADREEVQKLRSDVIHQGKKLFLTTMVATIFGETEEDLLTNVEQFTLKTADDGLKPNPLIGQQEFALKTTMLTGARYLILDRLLTSDNVVAINPFNIQEIMDKHGHFYGINSISKNMIMCLRRETKPVANGLVFGQSGSGKSFITKGEIIPNLLDTDDKIIILDPDNEYRALVEEGGFDGNVIDLKTKADFHINPCDMNMEYDEKDADPLTEKADFMVGLVESIMGKNRECNSFEVNAIHRAVNKMYEPYITEMDRRREEGRVQNIDTEICPTLEDFYKCLISESSVEAQKVANQIEPYCVGNYNIFAHKTDVDTSKRLIIYNLKDLPEKMKEMAMKVCLSSIWTEVARNREYNKKYNKKRAVWVYLDEFHLFFQTDTSASTIQAYFKRVRKYNGIMTGITQDVADLVRTPQGQGMFNNSGFFIILNQLPAGRAAVQRSLDIADSLIENIADKPSGVGLLKNNNIIVPINYQLSTDTRIFDIMSTNPNIIKEKKPEEAEEINNEPEPEVIEPVINNTVSEPSDDWDKIESERTAKTVSNSDEFF